jgi:hypothetical protein
MSSFNQGGPSISHVISTANCLIFGNTSSGSALSVQQLGAGNVASFRTTTGATALFVGGGGNVGVGTTDPGSNTVYVQTSGNGNGITVRGDNNTSITLTANNTSTLGAGVFRAGKISMKAADTSDKSLQFFNYSSDLTGATDMAYRFLNNNASMTTFVILNNGNVGIGTTNPGYTLQVNGSIGMVGGTTIPVTLPPIGSQTSYGITLAASGTWYTVITDARINATITGAIGQSDLTSTIFIATLYANGGASASMTLVTGSATNIRVSGTALQFNAVSGLYGLACNFTLLRHN